MKIRALLFLFFAAASGVHAAPWIASPEVIAGQRDSREIRGVVFEDLDGDGRHQSGEPGVVYPCTARDMQLAGREFCEAGRNPTYNARVVPTQVAWLENLLQQVPQDRLVVLMHHIPLVSYTSAHSPMHQTDNANELYALLAGRPALSISGHRRPSATRCRRSPSTTCPTRAASPRPNWPKGCG